ncbi:hypothetical protein Stsp02_27920 [Streptomyces sp. NBRC 14336]|uniref:hypothetical protein n=1 Tax=Streptomyces sp. NBRC 14336 TaxID=3030992 RepID=UPI0024A0D6EB|nr:hypothetical protein [Streptomyces sp. NBRC 14336]WBO82296.1 hypothetical protein SBE_006217 [Streptomyces sp. SBE_14.2]GLW47130.1 hypothetical protein Stsp02_27920 [Streptomyces sp. NBRC 14336]
MAARHIRGEAADPFVTPAATFAELLALTEETLRDPSLAGDSTTYVNLLSTLLAFEGVEGWSEHLLRSVFGRAQCAHCDADFSIFDAILSRC